MKRLAPWAIAAVVICTLLGYDAWEIVFDGAFVVPVRYGWNVPVSNGGTVVVRGVSEVGFGGEDARFEATYHPASSASTTSPTPDETIGTWRSEMWNPVAYVVGASIVFLPDPSHPFVRTMRGQWKPLEVRDSAAGPVWDTVRHVSPETRVLIVDRQRADGTLARLFLQLSVDGEQLTLTRTQEAQAARSP
jgi:hypothetical protein